MKKFRIIFAFLLVLSLTYMVFGCSGKENSDNKGNTESEVDKNNEITTQNENNDTLEADKSMML